VLRQGTRTYGTWRSRSCFIAVGVALAASLLFLFIDAPMVMIGVELLMPRSG
jgi:hypothetical protein